MWASYSEDKAPYSVVLGPKAVTRLFNEGRHRDEPHGREYKCKRCDDWLPWDTEFFSPRTSRGKTCLSKVCRVCERIRDGR